MVMTYILRSSQTSYANYSTNGLRITKLTKTARKTNGLEINNLIVNTLDDRDIPGKLPLSKSIGY